MIKRPAGIAKSSKASRPDRHIVISLILVAAIFISCAWFIVAYRDLRRAIQDERATFAEEIVAQIIAGHSSIREESMSSVRRLAKIADNSNAASLEELSEHFIEEDRDNILFISDTGTIIDLSGRKLFLADIDKRQSLLKTDEDSEMFASLNYEEDYWLFTSRIEPLVLAGKNCVAIVLALPQEEYRDRLTTTLYGGLGAAYIIRSDGSIEVRPALEHQPFDGYNLYSSLLTSGADAETVIALREDIFTRKSGSSVMDIGGTDWLVSFSAFSGEDMVIALVPLSVTAVRTYAGLDMTIASAICFIVLVAALAIMVFVRAIRRDRQREKAMVAAEAKSEFFSKMSHDIRTPLNAIVGLQTLAREKSEDPLVQRFLDQSATSTQYLLSIINDVLEMSRIESGKLTIDYQPFDMNGLLAEIKILVDSMASVKGISFTVDTDSPLLFEYIGDEVRLKQILVNVLNNAVKFTDAGGCIEFNVSHSAATDKSDGFVFIISDTGAGIREDFIDDIFTPFGQERSSYTGRAQGSGLGLAIVKSLVDLMGGSISATSKVGVGSVFTIHLTLDKGDPVKERRPAVKRELMRYPGGRVLLAEDNSINQMIAVRLLKTKFDLEAEVAENGAQAVQMFSDSAADHYDLVLMDIKMPKMDGLEATKAIRALEREDAKRIPIIALSANSFKEDVELSLAAGMNDHLAKPMDIEALSKALEKHLTVGRRHHET